MRYLADRLLVCLTLAFVVGIALAAADDRAWVGLAACGVICLALSALLRGSDLWSDKKSSSTHCPTRGRTHGILTSAALLFLAALAGALLYRAGGTPRSGTVDTLPGGGQTLTGVVAAAPQYRDGLWRFVFAVEGHEEGRRVVPVGGVCYVQFRTARRVERGQRWRLTGRLRRLTEARNPGGRSEAARLASLGVSSMFSVSGDQLADLLGPGDTGWLERHVCTAQARALSLLANHVGEPYPELTAQVAASVIFGVHAAPPPAEVSEDFRRAGTIHLLVVSGSMVSMVFGMVFLPGALGAGWRRRREEAQWDRPVSGRGRIHLYPGLWAAAAGMGVVVYYAILTEGGQAVWRAGSMGVLVALALALRRFPRVARQHGLNVDHYTLLAAAALVILAVQPRALFAPGFQLTFAAVWAILYLTPKLPPASVWLPKWLALSVGGTLAAQLGTFPILAWHYGNAPLAGLGANLLAVPLASVVLTAGMATCALGAIAPWAAFLPGFVTGWATRAMVWVSSAFASLPWAAPEIPRPAWWAMVTWYAGLVALGWWLGRFVQRRGGPST